MYQRAGVLWKEARGAEPEENPWGVAFQRMFDMSNDSGLFRTRDELEREGYALKGNVFVQADGREYLPLYEAKLFHQYDHRFATFAGASKEDLKSGNARDMTTAEKANAEAVVIPRYWVPAEEVAAKLDTRGGDTNVSSKLEARSSKLEARSSKLEARSSKLEARSSTTGDLRAAQGTRGWQLAFRSIARATDERTVVWTMMATGGLGNSGAVLEWAGSLPSGKSHAPRTNEQESTL